MLFSDLRALAVLLACHTMLAAADTFSIYKCLCASDDKIGYAADFHINVTSLDFVADYIRHNTWDRDDRRFNKVEFVHRMQPATAREFRELISTFLSISLRRKTSKTIA